MAVSLLTTPKAADELRGLVYALTPREVDTHLAWYRRPGPLAGVVLAFTVILNVLFW